MSGLKRMVSGNIDVTRYFFPHLTLWHTFCLGWETVFCDSSGGAQRNLESTMNAERTIFFQTVIFQRVRLVSGEKHICECITSYIDLWNMGAYNELLQDSYGMAADYLGNSQRTKIQDQRHYNFKTLLCTRNCAKPFILFVSRRQVKFFYLIFMRDLYGRLACSKLLWTGWRCSRVK